MGTADDGKSGYALATVGSASVAAGVGTGPTHRYPPRGRCDRKITSPFPYMANFFWTGRLFRQWENQIDLHKIQILQITTHIVVVLLLLVVWRCKYYYYLLPRRIALI